MSGKQSPELSIIIPIAPADSSWRELLPQLACISEKAETILALSTEDSRTIEEFQSSVAYPLVLTRGLIGRATQMNAAVTKAKGQHLWFLHADSKFSGDSPRRILDRLPELETGLFYLDLKYQKDGPLLCALNAVAANIRSRLFKIPFGDQGFLIQRSLFRELGSFPEDCESGEDHRFVRKVRQHGLPVRPLGEAVYSSARKYREHGWLKVTASHCVLFFKQLVKARPIDRFGVGAS